MKVTYTSTYHQLFYQKLRNDAPQIPSMFLEYVKDNTKQHSPLVHKFCIIASLLDPDGAEHDISQFKRINGFRNKLYHETGSKVDKYLSSEALNLLTKYLRLHLLYNK